MLYFTSCENSNTRIKQVNYIYELVIHHTVMKVITPVNQLL